MCLVMNEIYCVLGDLLGILNWRGPQFKDKLSENLDKLSQMQGDELVKVKYKFRNHNSFL